MFYLFIFNRLANFLQIVNQIANLQTKATVRLLEAACSKDYPTVRPNHVRRNRENGKYPFPYRIDSINVADYHDNRQLNNRINRYVSKTIELAPAIKKKKLFFNGATRCWQKHVD